VPLDESASTPVPVEKNDDRVPPEQAVRNLDEKARAVAALAVGVQSAAMREPRQGLDPELDRLVAQLGRRHEAHAAGGTGLGELPRPGKA
jgi:hypothetical protein